jgi:hypothetical protein
MMTLIRADIVPLAVALAIGLATGWWMFRHLRYRPRPNSSEGSDPQ